MNLQTPITVEPGATLKALGFRTSYGVNWLGLQTLYLREVRRFWKVGAQTVAGPVVTALLYMMIFTVAMSGGRPPIDGFSVAVFVGPGLIMMGVLNNAFQNSSSSLMQSKMNGTAPDFLTPPLSPMELTAGFTAGAMTRGILVGFVTAAAVWPFSRFNIAHPWAVVYFALIAALIMAEFGVLAGLWSQKFDQMAALTNFLVTPMTFLSGTFYLVDRLPEPFATISHLNPFFYLIDGFRYGFIGKAEGSLWVGVLFSAVLAVVMTAATWRMFATGWRLKS
ncbi:MAG: multidrug ABC transporter permease [Caulobacterales bacterium 32-69-10]|nr:MAG: multidrug ABC transporter permease [Caulobacterales bacterium 32-69-10]